MENDSIFISVALIFCGAALMATVGLYARQALPVVYVVLGALVGPGGFKLIPDVGLIEETAHIGIIFLLFLVGLELSPLKLLSLFKTVTWITVVASISFGLVAYAITIAFGFSHADALIAAIAAGFSSTIMGLKFLPTTVLHHKHIGQLVIGVLLIQDVLAIIALIAIPVMQSPTGLRFELIVPFIALPTLAAIVFFLEFLVIRRLIARFEQIREYIFLITIAWCLGFAELAVAFGLNKEIGAFIAGISLASSPICRYISESLKPLRDFFLVLFFVAIGAQVHFNTIDDVIIPALILAGAMLLIKPIVFRFLLLQAKESVAIAKEVGARLGQLSEFSLLVVFVSLSSGVLSEFASRYLVLATVITFIGSSYIVVLRYPSPLAVSDRLRRD